MQLKPACTVATPVAPLPWPPLIATDGALVKHCWPGLFKVRNLTGAPGSTISATAVAPEPPPPEMVTMGAVEYELPPASTRIEPSCPLGTGCQRAVAVASVPPASGASIVITGCAV